MPKNERDLTGGPYRYDEHGAVIGPGLYVPVTDQIGPGVVAMDVNLLNRLHELTLIEAMRPRTEFERQVERERERVRAEKDALIEDLRLDTSPPTLAEPVAICKVCGNRQPATRTGQNQCTKCTSTDVVIID